MLLALREPAMASRGGGESCGAMCGSVRSEAFALLGEGSLADAESFEAARLALEQLLKQEDGPCGGPGGAPGEIGRILGLIADDTRRTKALELFECARYLGAQHAHTLLEAGGEARRKLQVLARTPDEAGDCSAAALVAAAIVRGFLDGSGTDKGISGDGYGDGGLSMSVGVICALELGFPELRRQRIVECSLSADLAVSSTELGTRALAALEEAASLVTPDDWHHREPVVARQSRARALSRGRVLLRHTRRAISPSSPFRDEGAHWAMLRLELAERMIAIVEALGARSPERGAPLWENDGASGACHEVALLAGAPLGGGSPGWASPARLLALTYELEYGFSTSPAAIRQWLQLVRIWANVSQCALNEGRQLEGSVLQGGLLEGGKVVGGRGGQLQGGQSEELSKASLLKRLGERQHATDGAEAPLRSLRSFLESIPPAAPPAGGAQTNPTRNPHEILQEISLDSSLTAWLFAHMCLHAGHTAEAAALALGTPRSWRSHLRVSRPLNVTGADGLGGTRPTIGAVATGLGVPTTRGAIHVHGELHAVEVPWENCLLHSGGLARPVFTPIRAAHCTPLGGNRFGFSVSLCEGACALTAPVSLTPFSPFVTPQFPHLSHAVLFLGGNLCPCAAQLRGGGVVRCGCMPSCTALWCAKPRGQAQRLDAAAGARGIA